MRTFKDSNGREWNIGATIGCMNRVKALAGVDLVAMTDGDPPLLTRLSTDIMLLCNVIFAMVKPDADKAGITDEQFGAALGGEAITQAHDAFWSEMLDFFQSLRRPDVARAVEKQRELVKKAVALVEAKTARIDVELIGNTQGALMDAELQKLGLSA
jgi:hypothetical protein